MDSLFKFKNICKFLPLYYNNNMSLFTAYMLSIEHVNSIRVFHINYNYITCISSMLNNSLNWSETMFSELFDYYYEYCENCDETNKEIDILNRARCQLISI